MDRTVQDLVDLLLNAVPTILFFVFLTLYLNFIFFKPLARLLEERKKATEGVRDLAQRAFEAADQKTAEFERALQQARAEIHKHNEELRQQFLQEQSEAIAKARTDAEQQIQLAKRQIGQQGEQAEAELASTIDSLAERIIGSVLRRAA